MDNLSGQMVKGYEIREQIGAGGLGVVYRATQPGIGRDVAIKLIRPDFANHPDFIRRFETEAQLVARLEHPYIVPLYDYWRDASGAYLVMRWMRGNLQDALLPGPLPIEAGTRLLDQIAAALAVAHRHGVVHRDLKPANILRDAEENAYLADFGIAQAHTNRAFARPRLPGEGSALAEYLSPEQIREEPVSPQTDIYSLGVLLYEILTGAPPFRGPTPADVCDQHLYTALPPLRTRRPDLPLSVEAVIQRATAKDPAARYPDALSLTMDFHRALAPANAADSARPLPTGTVTFLFTDIEGSTARWERDPAAMKDALARHDMLLRRATVAHDGRVYQMAGDSFVIAFADAGSALQAAIAAQRTLQAETWPAPVAPLRVRLALHTGPAVRQDGEYHAELTLSRLSRLLAAAHGGQVLLSGSTRALLEAHLPEGVALHGLGEHRLRDLSHPLEVFQVVAPGLPAEFPPLRTRLRDGWDLGRAPGTSGIRLPRDDERVAENPYKGLRAFQEADSVDFFGREELIARLLVRLGEPGPPAHFLAVVGPSGSGKSSVIRAGVLPALRGGAVPGADHWFMVEMIPGTHPFEELAAALQRVTARPVENLAARLRGDDGGLTGVVAALLPADGETELLLVIDQFEEIFTLVDDEAIRAAFLAGLASAAGDPGSRLRVILTLRADFYDRPLLYPAIGELLRARTEVVLPLAADELERASVRPAERVGVLLEPDLIAAIVRDAGEQPGALPLLQYALTELFEHRAGRRLTLAAYRATGGVHGALARRADDLYADLAPPEQEVAHQLFLRLVTLGEGAEDTRRRVRRAELNTLGAADAAPPAASGIPHTLDTVLDTFGRHRLLTFDRDPMTRGPTVEVAHEALLRTWTRLRDWLDASRADLRVQRQLLAACGEWTAAGQDPSFLAVGARLAQFVGLAHEGRLALTADERAYVQASVAEQAHRDADERRRQARELSLQKQATTRLRVLLLVVATFLVFAVALAAFAFNQGRVAEANFTRAEAQRVAAEANTLLQARFDSPAPVIALLSIRSLNTAYSPQGDAALTGAAIRDYPRREFAGHAGSVLAVAFAPDGASLLTGNADGTATLWDTQTGAVRHRLSGHTDAVAGVAFSPDGKYALTGSHDATARLWDTATGAEIRRFVGHSAQVDSVAYSPDGTYVLTGSHDRTTRLWMAATGQEVRRFPGQTDSANGVAFSPDGKYVLTSGSSDKMAHLWDTTSGAEIRRFVGHDSSVIKVAFSPDGRFVLTGSLDSTAILWDTATGREIRRFTGHAHSVQGIAFSPDGRYVFTGSDDGTARLWDVQTGVELRRLVGHTAAVIGVAYSPDGQYLLTSSNDQTALLWAAQAQTGLPRFLGHANLINAQDVAFAPDGKTVLTGSSDKTVRLWDAKTGQQLRVFQGHTDHITSVAFAPDGKTILTASDDKTARLWDVATGAEIRRLALGPDGVGHAAISPDGRLMLTAGAKDGTLWDLQTGRPLRTLTGHSDVLWGVAFAPNGQWALTASADKTARLWDVATGRTLQVFRHDDWVTFAAASADSRWVVTTSSDKTARLWDAATGRLVHTFTGDTDQLWDAAFSPDSRYVVTASNDQTARLWDVATGAEVRRFSGHTDLVLGVAYSPDGRYVLTGSADNTARLWDVDYHATLAYLCGRLIRDFTDAERAQYNIPPRVATCPGR